MTHTLRSRLTIWYATLLLIAVVAFSATVLWLHWRLLLRQEDAALDSMASAAVNVVAAELAEDASLAQATREMEAVVQRPGYQVTVTNASAVAPPSVLTSTDNAGHEWRVARRTADARGVRFAVSVAVPMAAVATQWRVLLQACAIGIPFVLALAAAGGWLLGRRGLHPLAAMAVQARAITPRTPGSRLSVPRAGAELEDVAASFNRLLDRLETALATQRRFMADASHELRTPVSIMRTAADVTLSQASRDEAEYREALNAVAEQSSRLARLVDDMLVLARADAGGYPVRRADIDLDEVVRDCTRDLAPLASARRIRVSSRLEPVSVTADEALLRRMLGNIIGNAVTYTPEGGAVDVTMIRRGDAVAIDVSDTGPGVPLDARDRIFERFVRLDPARREGGAGLGLSIARWIAEAHGGSVELRTSGPEGSVFSATIPM